MEINTDNAISVKMLISSRRAKAVTYSQDVTRLTITRECLYESLNKAEGVNNNFINSLIESGTTT